MTVERTPDVSLTFRPEEVEMQRAAVAVARRARAEGWDATTTSEMLEMLGLHRSDLVAGVLDRRPPADRTA